MIVVIIEMFAKSVLNEVKTIDEYLIMCENNKEHKYITINILPQSPVAWFFIMWIGIFFACVLGEVNKY